MENEHIDIANIGTDTASTGIAQIMVSSAGENCIVIIPGANAAVDETFALNKIKVACSECTRTGAPKPVLLCQNEIPLETTLAAILCASDNGMRSIFNPAPAPVENISGLFRKLRQHRADIVCPNETELAALTGISTGKQC